jgi:phosphatidylinositol-3-phosphatase
MWPPAQVLEPASRAWLSEAGTRGTVGGVWRARLAGAATGLVGLLVASSTTALGATSPCGSLSSPPATYAHVVVIMEENLSYKNAIGSAKAPYFNMLASDCALATNFHNETHGSQPNYMAATSGYATGVGVHTTNHSIFEQVSSWNELEESMGGTCGVTATHYKRGHDPAFWYKPIATACKQFDLPMTASDAGATRLPTAAYTFITPNTCHDHHWETGCSGSSSTSVQAMDAWLSGTIQAIQQTTDYQAGQTLVLVTFDEGQAGTTGENCADPANTDPSCHIATIAVAAGVHAVSDPTFYTHYSLLRACEEALGITSFLGSAATATDMRPGMGF